MLRPTFGFARPPARLLRLVEEGIAPEAGSSGIPADAIEDPNNAPAFVRQGFYRLLATGDALRGEGRGKRRGRVSSRASDQAQAAWRQQLRQQIRHQRDQPA